MKIRILAVMMVLLSTGAAFAAAPEFGELDRDKDGYLTPAEVDEVAVELFKKQDRNGDGSLDRSEFEAAGGLSSRFAEMDRDRNSRVGLDEFRAAARKQFEQFDTNRDGRIDVQEWNKRQTPIQNPLILFYF